MLNLPHQNRLYVVPKPAATKPALCHPQTCCNKTGFAPIDAKPATPNRLCAVLKPAAPKLSLCLSQTCCTKTGFAPTLNLPHQNRLSVVTKPAFSFWIHISTVSEVRCDCQGLGLLARIEASILVFDTMQVLYWTVLGQIQFCNFDRICKTCLDTKPVLFQDRFCSWTDAGNENSRSRTAKYITRLSPYVSTQQASWPQLANWSTVAYYASDYMATSSGDRR